jgi:hypothetical protein
MSMRLGDDGTMDTVIVCSECGTELRYNFDGDNWDGIHTADLAAQERAYDEFVDESIKDAERRHICAVGYSAWASYLINGDASGISEDERKAADAFRAYLDADIVDCSENSFFGTPDAGADLEGDCVHYISVAD